MKTTILTPGIVIPWRSGLLRPTSPLVHSIDVIFTRVTANENLEFPWDSESSEAAAPTPLEPLCSDYPPVSFLL